MPLFSLLGFISDGTPSRAIKAECERNVNRSFSDLRVRREQPTRRDGEELQGGIHLLTTRNHISNDKCAYVAHLINF